MDPNLVAALGGLIGASGAVVTGVLATRSKVKLDDLATVQAELAKTKDELEAEKQSRTQDSERQRAEHDREIVRLKARIDVLTAEVDDRDRRLDRLDRMLLAARGYIAKLARVIVERGDSLPEKPEELR